MSAGRAFLGALMRVDGFSSIINKGAFAYLAQELSTLTMKELENVADKFETIQNAFIAKSKHIFDDVMEKLDNRVDNCRLCSVFADDAFHDMHMRADAARGLLLCKVHAKCEITLGTAGETAKQLFNVSLCDQLMSKADEISKMVLDEGFKRLKPASNLCDLMGACPKRLRRALLSNDGAEVLLSNVDVDPVGFSDRVEWSEEIIDRIVKELQMPKLSQLISTPPRYKFA